MNVLLAKEDGDKIGIISLLNQPIGERDVGTLALAVGILVAVDFLWEMSTDIVQHVRGRNQIRLRSSNVVLLPLHGSLACLPICGCPVGAYSASTGFDCVWT